MLHGAVMQRVWKDLISVGWDEIIKLKLDNNSWLPDFFDKAK